MKKVLLVLLIVGFSVLLVVTGVLVYLYIADDSGKDSEPVVTTQQGQEDDDTPTEVTTDDQPSVELTNYTISQFVTYPEVNLMHPDTWTAKQVGDLGSQPVYEFSKGDYTLTVSRPQGGGAECVFNSNFDPEMADFYLDISQYSYKKIDSDLGSFYYFNTGDKYEFCGPSSQIDGKLVQMNAVGIITFETPANQDSETMDEMVSIVESFQ